MRHALLHAATDPVTASSWRVTAARALVASVAYLGVHFALRDIVLAPVVAAAAEANVDVAGLPYETVWLLLLFSMAIAWQEARVRWMPARRRLTRGDLALILTLALLFGAALVASLMSGMLPDTRNTPAWLVTCILGAPLVEEWAFRGVLWQVIASPRSRRNQAFAWVVTAAVFALSHAGDPTDPLAMGWSAALNHFTMGLAFGALRWRFDSVAVAVAAHSLSNAAVIALATFARP